MENDDTTKNQGDTPTELPPVASKKQTRKERSKTNQASHESTKHQKHTLWRNWKSLSRTRQLELVFLGIVAIGGIGYLGVTIWGTLQAKWHFQAEHRPLVVHNRQPELLRGQTVSCNALDGHFYVGASQVAIKNIGNTTAYKVFPYTSHMQVVPEQKLGQPFYDDPPVVTDETCSQPTVIAKFAFPLAPGVENQSQSPSATGTIPPLQNGAHFQLFLSECVYYSDDNGGAYGTCDLYRLFAPVPNDPIGTPVLTCDGRPIVGTFVGNIFGHCQK